MFAIRTILHPTDFSENSDYAFRLACSLARDHGARLIVLHVAPPPMVYFGEGIVLPEPVNYEEPLREKLHELKAPELITMECRLVQGAPAEGILKVAREMNCDLIVLGTHGRTGLRRLLMGSVAEQIVRKAPCPVLTVKIPVAEAANAEKPASRRAEMAAR